MTASEIEGLRHWSFISLFEENRDIYTFIFYNALFSIKSIINVYPSVEELENSVKGLLVEEEKFAYHCKSKKSYNVQWNLKCLESFSRYIVFRLYGILKRR